MAEEIVPGMTEWLLGIGVQPNTNYYNGQPANQNPVYTVPGSGSSTGLVPDVTVGPGGQLSGQDPGSWGGTGGAGESSLNAEDFASTSESASESYSGPPAWLMNILKGMGPDLQRSFGRYGDAVEKFDTGGRGLIENARRGEVDQYRRDFRQPLQNEMGSAMLGAKAGGMLSSSSFADSMARISEKQAASQERVHSQANVRAQDRLLQHINQGAAMKGGVAGLLGNLMGLSRYGESQSQGTSYNPGAILGLLGL